MEHLTTQEGREPAIPSQPEASVGTLTNHRPVFLGSGGEYFRIWIVNTLLSLLTLGIYSAWATVRNRRYLYGSTELDGDRFDFHGKPLAILRGRILAVALFAAYAFGGDFHYMIPLIALLILLVSFPWIFLRAMQFRLGNTSWRSLRFGFPVKTRQVYEVLVLPLIVVTLSYGLFFWLALKAQDSEGLMPDMKLFLFSFGIMLLASFWFVPVLNYRIRNLLMNHIHFGDHRFQADIELRVFFMTYLKALGTGIAVFCVAVLIVGGLFIALGSVLSAENEASMIAFMAIIYSVLIVVYLLPFAVWQVLTTNHVISATHVRSVSFSMEMNVWALWWTLLSNAVLAVLTLGLAIPWTKIRMIRYKLSCLKLEGDLRGFSGSRQPGYTATGEEVVDAFDLDFGF